MFLRSERSILSCERYFSLTWIKVTIEVVPVCFRQHCVNKVCAFFVLFAVAAHCACKSHHFAHLSQIDVFFRSPFVALRNGDVSAINSDRIYYLLWKLEMHGLVLLGLRRLP